MEENKQRKGGATNKKQQKQHHATEVNHLALRMMLQAKTTQAPYRLHVPGADSSCPARSASMQLYLSEIAHSKEKSIDLSHCGLAENDFVILRHLLVDHPTIQHVDFSDNKLNENAAKILLEIARDNSLLHSFNLDGTEIEEIYADEIHSILEANYAKYQVKQQKLAAKTKLRLEKEIKEVFQRLSLQLQSLEAENRLDFLDEEARNRSSLSLFYWRCTRELIAEQKKLKEREEQRGKMNVLEGEEAHWRQYMTKLERQEVFAILELGTAMSTHVILNEQHVVREKLKRAEKLDWVASRKAEKVRLEGERSARQEACDDETGERRLIRIAEETEWPPIWESCKESYSDARYKMQERKDRERREEAARQRAAEVAKEKKLKEEKEKERQAKELSAKQSHQREKLEAEFNLSRRNIEEEQKSGFEMLPHIHRIFVRLLSVENEIQKNFKRYQQLVHTLPNVYLTTPSTSSLSASSVPALAYHFLGSHEPTFFASPVEFHVHLSEDWLKEVQHVHALLLSELFPKRREIKEQCLAEVEELRQGILSGQQQSQSQSNTTKNPMNVSDNDKALSSITSAKDRERLRMLQDAESKLNQESRFDEPSPLELKRIKEQIHYANLQLKMLPLSSGETQEEEEAEREEERATNNTTTANENSQEEDYLFFNDDKNSASSWCFSDASFIPPPFALSNSGYSWTNTSAASKAICLNAIQKRKRAFTEVTVEEGDEVNEPGNEVFAMHLRQRYPSWKTATASSKGAVAMQFASHPNLNTAIMTDVLHGFSFISGASTCNSTTKDEDDDVQQKKPERRDDENTADADGKRRRSGQAKSYNYCEDPFYMCGPPREQHSESDDPLKGSGTVEREEIEASKKKERSRKPSIATQLLGEIDSAGSPFVKTILIEAEVFVTLCHDDQRTKTKKPEEVQEEVDEEADENIVDGGSEDDDKKKEKKLKKEVKKITSSLSKILDPPQALIPIRTAPFRVAIIVCPPYLWLNRKHNIFGSVDLLFVEGTSPDAFPILQRFHCSNTPIVEFNKAKNSIVTRRGLGTHFGGCQLSICLTPPAANSLELQKKQKSEECDPFASKSIALLGDMICFVPQANICWLENHTVYSKNSHHHKKDAFSNSTPVGSRDDLCSPTSTTEEEDIAKTQHTAPPQHSQNIWINVSGFDTVKLGTVVSGYLPKTSETSKEESDRSLQEKIIIQLSPAATPDALWVFLSRLRFVNTVVNPIPHFVDVHVDFSYGPQHTSASSVRVLVCSYQPLQLAFLPSSSATSNAGDVRWYRKRIETGQREERTTEGRQFGEEAGEEINGSNPKNDHEIVISAKREFFIHDFSSSSSSSAKGEEKEKKGEIEEEVDDEDWSSILPQYTKFHLFEEPNLEVFDVMSCVTASQRKTSATTRKSSLPTTTSSVVKLDFYWHKQHCDFLPANKKKASKGKGNNSSGKKKNENGEEEEEGDTAPIQFHINSRKLKSALLNYSSASLLKSSNEKIRVSDVVKIVKNKEAEEEEKGGNSSALLSLEVLQTEYLKDVLCAFEIHVAQHDKRLINYFLEKKKNSNSSSFTNILTIQFQAPSFADLTSTTRWEHHMQLDFLSSRGRTAVPKKISEPPIALPEFYQQQHLQQNVLPPSPPSFAEILSSSCVPLPLYVTPSVNIPQRLLMSKNDFSSSSFAASPLDIYQFQLKATVFLLREQLEEDEDGDVVPSRSSSSSSSAVSSHFLFLDPLASPELRNLLLLCRQNMENGKGMVTCEFSHHRKMEKGDEKESREVEGHHMPMILSTLVINIHSSVLPLDKELLLELMTSIYYLQQPLHPTFLDKSIPIEETSMNYDPVSIQLDVSWNCGENQLSCVNLTIPEFTLNANASRLYFSGLLEQLVMNKLIEDDSKQQEESEKNLSSGSAEATSASETENQDTTSAKKRKKKQQNVKNGTSKEKEEKSRKRMRKSHRHREELQQLRKKHDYQQEILKLFVEGLGVPLPELLTEEEGLTTTTSTTAKKNAFTSEENHRGSEKIIKDEAQTPKKDEGEKTQRHIQCMGDQNTAVMPPGICIFSPLLHLPVFATTTTSHQSSSSSAAAAISSKNENENSWIMEKILKCSTKSLRVPLFPPCQHFVSSGSSSSSSLAGMLFQQQHPASMKGIHLTSAEYYDGGRILLEFPSLPEGCTNLQVEFLQSSSRQKEEGHYRFIFSAKKEISHFSRRQPVSEVGENDDRGKMKTTTHHDENEQKKKNKKIQRGDEEVIISRGNIYLENNGSLLGVWKFYRQPRQKKMNATSMLMYQEQEQEMGSHCWSYYFKIDLEITTPPAAPSACVEDLLRCLHMQIHWRTISQDSFNNMFTSPPSSSPWQTLFPVFLEISEPTCKLPARSVMTCRVSKASFHIVKIREEEKGGPKPPRPQSSNSRVSDDSYLSLDSVKDRPTQWNDEPGATTTSPTEVVLVKSPEGENHSQTTMILEPPEENINGKQHRSSQPNNTMQRFGGNCLFSVHPERLRRFHHFVQQQSLLLLQHEEEKKRQTGGLMEQLFSIDDEDQSFEGEHDEEEEEERREEADAPIDAVTITIKHPRRKRCYQSAVQFQYVVVSMPSSLEEASRRGASVGSRTSSITTTPQSTPLPTALEKRKDSLRTGAEEGLKTPTTTPPPPPSAILDHDQSQSTPAKEENYLQEELVAPFYIVDKGLLGGENKATMKRGGEKRLSLVSYHQQHDVLAMERFFKNQAIATTEQQPQIINPKEVIISPSESESVVLHQLPPLHQLRLLSTSCDSYEQLVSWSERIQEQPTVHVQALMQALRAINVVFVNKETS